MFIGGDFNEEPEGRCFVEVMNESFTDLYSVLKQQENREMT